MTRCRKTTELEATFLDAGNRNSGSIPQSRSHPDDSRVSTPYFSDTELLPFESPTIDGDVATEAFADQIGSSLLQLLSTVSGIPQWPVTKNSLLPQDTAVHCGPTPVTPLVFDQEASRDVVHAQFESFTALLKDAFDVSGPLVQYGSGRNDAHAIFEVDENASAGLAVAEMYDHMDLHHFSQMPEQRTSMCFQQGTNTEMLFPTLSTFTSPVSGLPQWPAIHPSQYYSFPHAAVQATVNPLSLGSFDGYSHPSVATNIYVSGTGQPDEVYLTPVMHQLHGAHSQMTVESAIYGYSDNTDYSTMGAMMAPGAATPYLQDSLGTSGNTVSEQLAFTPYDMVVTPSKRKADDNVRAIYSGPPLPPASTETRKRRRVKIAEAETGKFGAYVVADANAIPMPMPSVDYDPVDTSGRRTYDVNGRALQTRNYGVMEIDDSYGNRSATVSKELPAHLTCVRPCEWSDHPCGLYIEMSKDRISNHLANWHGVTANAKVPCNFRGCADTSAMNNLGRHIENVHYATSWQCRYCGKPLSRSDAAARHRKTCRHFRHAENQAALAGPTTQCAKKVLTGYIIPAREATYL